MFWEEYQQNTPTKIELVYFPAIMNKYQVLLHSKLSIGFQSLLNFKIVQILKYSEECEDTV